MTIELRIVGPPGTGKTRRLARHVEAAAAKYGSGAILVSSFTRAAARVIASRVDLPEDQVATLHAHAFRALGRPQIAEGKAKDWNERRGTRDAWRVTARSSGRLDDPLDDDARAGEGDRLLQSLNLFRARMVPEAFWPDDVRSFAVAWNAWKADEELLDFTDLIERALQFVDEAPGRPAVGMFDEVQDWSPLELALVRKWGSRMSAGFLLAGDPDQVLYTFKGASPRSFHEPPIPDERYEVLEQSFRVPGAVHAEALAWIRRANWRVDVPYRPRPEVGRVQRGNDGGPSGSGWSQPAALVDGAIEDLKKTGRSQMILASCSFMLAPTCIELRRRGVPFWNPYRLANGSWNPLRGGAERLVEFLRGPRPDLLGGYDPSRVRSWTWGELWRWLEPLAAAGVLRRGPGRGKGLVEAWASDSKTRDEIAAPGTLGSLVFEAATWNDLVDLLRSPYPWRFLATHALSSWKDRLAYALAIAEGPGPASLVEEPRVVVGTAHSVKGGEAARVVLFPDLSPAGWSEWLGGGDGQDSVRRTFYVGMTRASEELVLAGASSSMSVAWGD